MRVRLAVWLRQLAGAVVSGKLGWFRVAVWLSSSLGEAKELGEGEVYASYWLRIEGFIVEGIMAMMASPESRCSFRACGIRFQ